MANLTSGEMFYERRVTTGQYEHKMFSARISWNADEGDTDAARDHAMQLAAGMAVRVVHEHLGLGKSVLPVPVTPPAASDLAAAVALAKTVELNLPKKQNKPERVVVTGGHPIPPATNADVAACAIAGDELLGPISAATVAAPPSPSPAPAAEPSTDPLLAELEAAQPAPAPAEISDEELNSAVTKKFGSDASAADKAKFPAFKLGLPKFAPQIRGVPQERRAEFLAWLAKL